MKEKVIDSLKKFIEWLDETNFYSYDQYDFWNTRFGIWGKRLYYKNKYLGAPWVAPVFAADLFFPGSRKFFTQKKRFPIADAHFVLAFLNLYTYYSKKHYLQQAKAVADCLLKSSITGYSGYCWGYPFNWMTTRGLWKSGVPLITTTGYCFEAFLKLYDVTLEQKYLDIAHSIFTFTLKDLSDSFINDECSASSYSPLDNSRIINASAYRSFVLIEGFRRFQNSLALSKALSNINFVLDNQLKDGSWLYSASDKRDYFVDNFHTCFVLKNLFKVNKVLQDEMINCKIKKGFFFYKTHLLANDHSPIPFARVPRLNIVKKEMYDYAEGISLCLNMKNIDSCAEVIAEKLVKDVVTQYQQKNGSFITRINVFNIPNKIPFLRWPQAQLFYALTNYLLQNNYSCAA